MARLFPDMMTPCSWAWLTAAPWRSKIILKPEVTHVMSPGNVPNWRTGRHPAQPFERKLSAVQIILSLTWLVLVYKQNIWSMLFGIYKGVVCSTRNQHREPRNTYNKIIGSMFLEIYKGMGCSTMIQHWEPRSSYKKWIGSMIVFRYTRGWFVQQGSNIESPEKLIQQ